MISVLVPTRNRPERLGQMYYSLMDTAASRKNVEIYCYVSDDDDSYDFTRYPFINFVRGPRLIQSDLWNALIPHAHGDIFQQSADDVIYRTQGWDLHVERAFEECEDRIMLAYTDDGGPNGKVFASLPFVHRRWVETIGYFTGQGFSADFSDAWPNDVAEMIGRRKFLDGVLIEHMHCVWSKAPMDQTYMENRQRYQRDRPDLKYVRTLPDREADAEKLRAVLGTPWKQPIAVR